VISLANLVFILSQVLDYMLLSFTRRYQRLLPFLSGGEESKSHSEMQLRGANS
jgi:hypothetical protein